MAMQPEQVEALIDDLQTFRAQADVLRWQNHFWLMVLRRKRLAREVNRARRTWSSEHHEGDERLA